MAAVTLWVLARPRDPARALLAQPPTGVRAVFGAGAADFAGAPAPDALLVCFFGRDVVEPVFNMARGLRWVHSRAAGVDPLLFPELVESPVTLTNSRGVFSRALAEFVVGAVLFFAKDFRRLIRQQEERRWEPFEPDDVHGRVLGVVGYGDIGRAVAERVRPLGMRVLGLRRRPGGAAGDGLADEILGPERLHELLGRSDYVLVATPLTAETRGLIGEAELAALPPRAVLINVGRGPVVQEAPLLQALNERRLRGAALDVFETEPLPPDHPFYALDNVLLSPHSADHTPGWLDDAGQAFLRNLERFTRGEALLNVVDKRRGY